MEANCLNEGARVLRQERATPAELEADADIAAGRVSRFDDAEAFLAALPDD
jgi:hypothetical protein